MAAVVIVAALLIRAPSRPPDAPGHDLQEQGAGPSSKPSSSQGRPEEKTNSSSSALPTQGQVAVMLASRIGLGDNLTEDRAIGLLASRGIVPEAGWTKSGPATETTILQLQKTVHVLLTQMANDLNIRVPATLNLFIFDRGQMGGQVFHVGPKDMATLRASGGVVRPEALKAAQTARVSIEAPNPYPIGDDQLPSVWSYRLRRPGANFIRVHFEKLDLAAPNHLRILDRYGQEGWRYVGGRPESGGIWADAVDGDTAIIVMHAGAVASGAGLKIDSYSYGAPTPIFTK